MPTTVRLDRKDADFVDVLHTDSKSILQLGLGMSQAIGHLDFYPNGFVFKIVCYLFDHDIFQSGNDQPGCNDDRIKSILNGDLTDGTRKLVACNHDRAIQYFIESINGKGCQFSSYSCDSWSSFNLKNRCNTCGKSGSFCSEMGFNAIKWKRFKSDKKSKKFYLRTNSDKPFCGKFLKKNSKH